MRVVAGVQTPTPGRAVRTGWARPADVVRLLRPRQWTKNVLVLAAPGAAGLLVEPGAILDTATAFCALSLAASGTYALNDAADAEADRSHPTKRDRPVASGLVSPLTARVIGVVLLAAGVVVGATVSLALAIVVASYVALTTAYSSRLKHEPIADIVAVAAGFVLRAIAGAAAVEVEVSRWFLIVATFGSLLMVVGKRTAELGLDEAGAHRRILSKYSETFLGHVRTLAATGALLSYSLFAFERSEDVSSDVPWFELTLMPFAYGILRYLWRADDGQGGDPTELVLTDRVLLACGVVWAGLFAVGVHAG